MKRIVFPLLALLGAAICGLGQTKTGPATNPLRIFIKFRSGTQSLEQARAAVPKSLLESRNLADAPQSSAPLVSMLSANGIVGLRAVKPEAGLEPLPAGIERLFIADLGLGANAGAAVRFLADNPDVEYAEPDAIARITGVQANAAGQYQSGTGRVTLAPNDPKFSLQWGLQNTGQTLTLDNGKISVTGTPGADINAPDAWDISTGSGNIVLAVLDSGIALNHPEFAGRVVTGYDFVHQRVDTTDDQGHGTAVASVAAATGGNGILIAGVDWKCKILPVKVIDATGAASYSNIILGLEYAKAHETNVINLSAAGTTASSALRDEVLSVTGAGIILVASVGNDNTESPYYPAAYPNVIAVGATNSKDQRAAPFSCPGSGGSNYNSRLDFVAPGDLIAGLSHADQIATTAWCGTSLAAPMVSGTVTLILSVNPTLTNDQVFALLKAGARDQVGLSSEDTQGWDKYYGWGRIDGYRSLLTAKGTRLFSQTVIGGGYSTVFTFFNTGSSRVTGNLILTLSDLNGNVVNANLVSSDGATVIGSSISVNIPQGGTTFVTATAANPNVLAQGLARLEVAGGLLNGVATFLQRNSSGVIQAVAGVLPADAIASATIPVDYDVSAAQQRYTGYAIANPSTTSAIAINVLLVNKDGVRGPALNQISIGPGKQVSTFIHLDSKAPRAFKGSVALIGQGGATFSVVALVYNQGLSTVIPVIPSKVPNIN